MEVERRTAKILANCLHLVARSIYDMPRDPYITAVGRGVLGFTNIQTLGVGFLR